MQWEAITNPAVYRSIVGDLVYFVEEVYAFDAFIWSVHRQGKSNDGITSIEQSRGERRDGRFDNSYDAMEDVETWLEERRTWTN